MKRTLLVLGLGLLVAASSVRAQVSAAPSLLNFQGRLATSSGNPVPNGNYSVRFSLWNVASGGTAGTNEKWSQTVAAVQVKNGTFAVLLSGFPATTFDGNLWLEIKIGTDTPLSPRQQLVSVAYAMKANAVADGGVTGASIAAGTITADKFASNALAWLLGGNSGINPATQFLGTTDNQPVVFKSNNQRALRLEYVVNGNAFGQNVLGGYWGNSITSDVVGATVWGGLLDTGNNLYNRVTDRGGTVSGGANNQAGDGSGTVNNRIYATVGGGFGNVASGENAVIAGGFGNTSSGEQTTISGGYSNNASGSAATIAGGFSNTSSGLRAVVSGGTTNTASGDYAAVAGGFENIAAGQFSFAAGRRAKANHTGTFVWSDANDPGVASTADNQFLIFASGGVGIGTNAPAARLHILGGAANGTGLILENTDTGGKRWQLLSSGSVNSTGAGSLIFSDQSGGGIRMVLDEVGNVGIGQSNPGAGFKLDVNGIIRATGALNTSSDARYKTHVQTVPDALDSILGLRGVTYDWKHAEFPTMNFADGKQIGFIAQEVEKVLPQIVTTDEKGYKSVAYQSVIPVLVEAVKTQEKKIDALEKQLTELKELIRRMPR